jgi:putative peptide zinc metalloprotease protein
MNNEEPQAVLPKRPAALRAPHPAPGVELVGEQPDTGFKEKQWLVRREGRFLQVSELLYRILERLDGRRSLPSVAADVTDAMPWTVTVENVQQIIETKLIPAGLVAAPNGTPASQRKRPRSPLAVSARRTVIGPRALDPITRVLDLLFFPPLLAAVLAWIALAHLWLYLGHGIGGPIRDALMQPALALLAMLIFVVTAAFHELGHASALRYGGGRAGGIGVGFYLIYPAFFTDTADAYRLGRWARVRVDLGGFYFQLIAAVALMGLASASGQEWLLLPVLMINLEALRQLLFPFVRLDGYWLFADLAGIPDFFSHAVPFVRSLLPGSLRKRGELPALRRSTKAVFLAYLVATVPILGFLFFQIATRAPDFVVVAWQSFLAQKGSLAHAVVTGDVAQAAGSLGQMLILAMPAIGTAVLSLVVTAWLASALWRRRQLAPRTPRRAAF